MSLKAFHLFFLCIAILFDYGLAAYAFLGPENELTAELKPLGIGSGILGTALLIYGVWFVTKKSPKIIV